MSVRQRAIRGGDAALSVRMKDIGLAALLCLALGLTLLAAAQGLAAIHRFAQSQRLAESGDVRAIRPWMTLPYVARIYHVPEPYLLQTLSISDPGSVRHVTLSTLAGRLHTTSDALIKKVQDAILAYRHEHPQPTPPARQHSPPPLAGRETPA